MQKKKGISLIVLVITIIVMIILAASVVISLNNTGVINKASHAVDLTNEAQVQDLAALTWAECYMEKYRDEQLASKVKEKLTEQGITEDKWNITVSNSGVTVESKKSNGNSEENIYESYNHDAPELHLSGVIPEGGRYVHEASNQILPNMTYDGTSYELNAGDEFPANVYSTDYFYYGDYVYTTKKVDVPGDAANSAYKQTGWRFEVVDKTKTSYGPVLESIAGINVTSAFKAYANCTNLTVAPVLPKNAIEYFWGVFGNTQITDLPEGAIPNGVTTVNNSFTVGTFPTTLKNVYIPETVMNVQRFVTTQLGTVEKLYMSCKTTIEMFTALNVETLNENSITYYHHSTCDGTCGK